MNAPDAVHTGIGNARFMRHRAARPVRARLRFALRGLGGPVERETYLPGVIRIIFPVHYESMS
jgi:hypothetical protein